MAAGWSVMDALNKNSKAAVEDKPKARFRTRDISIKKMYSNSKNFYSVSDIEELAQGILAVGLIQNIAVTYDPCDSGEYRIISGERRWRALQLLLEKGHEEFEIATCQIMTPAEEHEEVVQLIVANAYRNKSVEDILQEEKQLKESLQYMKDNGLTLKGYDLNSGRLRDVIANIMNTTATKVAQIESINKRLIPEFTEELREGRLTFSAAYEISGMGEEAQQKMLERYRKNGLTWKEVKEAKQESVEKKTDVQTQEDVEDQDEPLEDECQEAEDDVAEEHEEEWEQAHPESIVSLCYSCKRCSDCNVKTGTCEKCDRYVNKADAEKTAEQRYSEKQDEIDRETARKLRERAQEEKMNNLPSEKDATRVHQIKLGASFFDDVAEGRKKFELRKNDRGYKVGDIIWMEEFENGEKTGRAVQVKVIYMLEDFTGLEEGYCIMGIELLVVCGLDEGGKRSNC